MSLKQHSLHGCAWLLSVLLTACTPLASKPTQPPPQPVMNVTPLDNYLEMLSALCGTDRARQSDVFYEVEKNFIQAPTTANSLRYGLALSVPGHPASDAAKGKRLLEELTATPERLSDTERALSVLLITVSDDALKLSADNRRLSATVDDRNKAQANFDRRAQAQNDELARLRKALDAAQQKLDAIRNIERSISERSTSPIGTREPGNRDTATQTQTPPAGR